MKIRECCYALVDWTGSGPTISFIKCSEKTTQSEGKHRGIDFAIRELVRRTTGHACTASLHYLYTPVELGGCGLTSAMDQYKMQAQSNSTE